MTVSSLMPVVYDERRRLARSYLARERGAQTIRATALVHEAHLSGTGGENGCRRRGQAR